jgi:hypothetical protein
MNGNPIFIAHFVEFVYTDNPSIRENHGTTLEIELALWCGKLKQRARVSARKLKLTETASRWTTAVNPAALEPFPEVYTAIGATCRI